jgi:hypothetical protein
LEVTHVRIKHRQRGGKERLREVLDFLVTDEQLGVTPVRRALVRFAQGELGKEIGPPNDVGFENFDWPTLGAVREALEARHRLRGRDLTARQVLRIPWRPARQRRRHPRQPHAARLNAPPRGARLRSAGAAHAQGKR